ncbi:uncharacterized protein LOC125957892 isoform X2 [Anopheles darlingi]|uniref:uncharacterized protein LOC125957892 isoform X2 n=1 Tax=Anopheles darlingi TaxID=43151 RepID=UPI0021003DF9|nr:uncharacterized protein LOC125957892 isoform X2 [Anopheles darlingi]
MKYIMFSAASLCSPMITTPHGRGEDSEHPPGGKSCAWSLSPQFSTGQTRFSCVTILHSKTKRYHASSRRKLNAMRKPKKNCHFDYPLLLGASTTAEYTETRGSV